MQDPSSVTAFFRDPLSRRGRLFSPIRDLSMAEGTSRLAPWQCPARDGAELGTR
jgi:hypothetical protein